MMRNGPQDDASGSAGTARAENAIASAEEYLAKTATERRHGRGTLRPMLHELFGVLDGVSYDQTIRMRVVSLLAALSKHDGTVLEFVIENARQYASGQHIDDASPHSPNGFDVLREIGGEEPRVTQFLIETVQCDWGIPRWDAIGALCRLGGAEADEFLGRVVQGKYPPKCELASADLREIEKWKGPEFVRAHLQLIEAGPSERTNRTVNSANK